MNEHSYVVATVKTWNIKAYNETIRFYPGKWHLIESVSDLTLEKIKALNPKYVFFPHWNHIVPDEIIEAAECVCFHETDLPYGRGGSPIQNLINHGHKETMISALRMTKELDAGPVYIKRPLFLYGSAEEIFLRASKIVAEMIKEVIIDEPLPIEQTGVPTLFKRRTPSQSELPADLNSLEDVFDYIRMLDADGYPIAFIEHGNFQYEISRAALRTESVEAAVRITLKRKKDVSA